MNAVRQRVKVSALGLLLLGLCACAVTGEGYVGGVYETGGYDYGGWRQGYHVGPPLRAVRRPERSSPPVYQPAPRSRPVPSIPTLHHGR